jgi:hypothetical protein
MLHIDHLSIALVPNLGVKPGLKADWCYNARKLSSLRSLDHSGRNDTLFPHSTGQILTSI